MFATLLGGLPWPEHLAARGDLDAAVAAAVAAQVDAGLAVVTDGGLTADDPVAGWRRAVTAAGGAAIAKAVLVGPWTRAGLDAADAVGDVIAAIVALWAEGCALVEVAEPAAARVGADPASRRAFRQAHVRLVADATEAAPGVHLSLSVAGSDRPAVAAGAATILAAGYASLAVDLIAAPDDWALVVAAPAGMGIVAGVLGCGAGADEGPELPLWGAAYAAATNARGADRVGIAIGHGLERLAWDVAARKLRALGAAARVASMPPGEAKARRLDPRAVSAKSAAAGRYAPPSRGGQPPRGRASR